MLFFNISLANLSPDSDGAPCALIPAQLDGRSTYMSACLKGALDRCGATIPRYELMTDSEGEQSLMLGDVAVAWVSEGNEGRPAIYARCANWSLDYELARRSFATLGEAEDAFAALVASVHRSEGAIARWTEEHQAS